MESEAYVPGRVYPPPAPAASRSFSSSSSFQSPSLVRPLRTASSFESFPSAAGASGAFLSQSLLSSERSLPRSSPLEEVPNVFGAAPAYARLVPFPSAPPQVPLPSAPPEEEPETFPMQGNLQARFDPSFQQIEQNMQTQVERLMQSQNISQDLQTFAASNLQFLQVQVANFERTVKGNLNESQRLEFNRLMTNARNDFSLIFTEAIQRANAAGSFEARREALVVRMPELRLQAESLANTILQETSSITNISTKDLLETPQAKSVWQATTAVIFAALCFGVQGSNLGVVLSTLLAIALAALGLDIFDTRQEQMSRISFTDQVAPSASSRSGGLASLANAAGSAPLAILDAASSVATSAADGVQSAVSGVGSAVSGVANGLSNVAQPQRGRSPLRSAERAAGRQSPSPGIGEIVGAAVAAPAQLVQSVLGSASGGSPPRKPQPGEKDFFKKMTAYLDYESNKASGLLGGHIESLHGGGKCDDVYRKYSQQIQELGINEGPTEGYVRVQASTIPSISATEVECIVEVWRRVKLRVRERGMGAVIPERREREEARAALAAPVLAAQNEFQRQEREVRLRARAERQEAAKILREQVKTREQREKMTRRIGAAGSRASGLLSAVLAAVLLSNPPEYQIPSEQQLVPTLFPRTTVPFSNLTVPFSDFSLAQEPSAAGAGSVVSFSETRDPYAPPSGFAPPPSQQDEYATSLGGSKGEGIYAMNSKGGYDLQTFVFDPAAQVYRQVVQSGTKLQFVDFNGADSTINATSSLAP